MIYEGMWLYAYPDGTFEVGFLAETPAMPTTFRLQLQVLGSPGSSGALTWYTLTLPPIRVSPERNHEGRALSGPYRVRHCGYSAAIDMLDAEIVEVRRHGTARFGFGPPSRVIASVVGE